MRLDELAATAEPIRVVGDSSVEIADLAYDSREVGPGTLFFCVPGRNFDPHDFAADIAAGRRASVQLLVDGTRANTATVALGYATRIVARFGLARGAEVAARAGPARPTAGVDFRTRAWYNPDLESRVYNVPAVMGTIVMLLSLMLTSLAVVREREIGTLEQIMVTPIRPAEFILGKTLPFFLIGMLDVALIATVGSLWFQVPFRGHILVLVMGAVLFLLCMLGAGLLISTVSATQQQALVTAFFFVMPAIAFSGFGFPINTMPLWLQEATYADPLRYFLVVLRGVYLKGVGFDILWPQMAGMAVLGTLMLALSVLRFRTAMD